MKIIALGDTHGRPYWKMIVAATDFDKVVFIGDYFDSREGITPDRQLSNFADLTAYKRDNPEKVILLLGNHDYHYLRFTDEIYSGFQDAYKEAFGDMLHMALDAGLLQMCWMSGNYLFTHAGVTKTWLKNAGYTEDIAPDVFINDLFQRDPSAFRFTAGVNQSRFGDDVCQTPVWVRPQSLIQDGLDDYIQVVGHTVHDALRIVKDRFAFIDTLGTSGEFLCITDGIMSAGQRPYTF